ncbi:MAG: cytochrome c [Candidatus Thioglobus sp.]|jgi:cytochrome c556|nr:cytochrome c [Candidatus Thioglobus sp.]MBT5165152.1 cytochrome c [Candidatus Thioglobus sp.]MBT7295345.1 cytochrome c [Candidatus Thioglobus sp.]
MKIIKRTLLLLTFIFLPLAHATQEDPDKRTIVHLDAEERNIVLEEMRTFLSTLQKITQGVATNDMQLVETAAKTMGQDASGGVSLSLIFKLPLSFKLYAADTHQKFDQIALDAGSLADRDHTLEQVSVLMQNCVACHAMYRIEKED